MPFTYPYYFYVPILTYEHVSERIKCIFLCTEESNTDEMTVRPNGVQKYFNGAT